MNTTTLFALWIAGLLAITWAAGCGFGITYARKKGTTHAHARRRAR